VTCNSALPMPQHGDTDLTEKTECERMAWASLRVLRLRASESPWRFFPP
jgi:hypothetical protein